MPGISRLALGYPKIDPLYHRAPKSVGILLCYDRGPGNLAPVAVAVDKKDKDENGVWTSRLPSLWTYSLAPMQVAQPFFGLGA